MLPRGNSSADIASPSKMLALEVKWQIQAYSTYTGLFLENYDEIKKLNIHWWLLLVWKKQNMKWKGHIFQEATYY